ncbi:flap endonuclease-1 [Candidatus Woesearchaeota archaeon]|nr:flap endonuclease-1 [Candidatus Woesearchaeota archaeon]
MGVAFGELINGEEVTIEALQGKIIAIDAMNMLYQFVTTIRQHDGTPLKDSHGNITSHLTGLFARCSRLMEKGLKLVFVFDGEMPPLKKLERERRQKLKEEAATSFAEAEASNNLEEMRKFASRSARVTTEMINESKELLQALGIPVVEAPSEGEAQAAYMVAKGDCDYVASQDFDCLIYGAPRVVRNLSLSQKRKKINALTYKTILPEIVTLDKTLKDLKLNLEQLRSLSIIIGTDFNIGGVKGLGPKKGLSVVKEFKTPENIFKNINFSESFPDVTWQEVYDTISKMPNTDNYSLVWKDIDEDKVKDILVKKHDFSESRVLGGIEAVALSKKLSQQTNLGKFF